MPTIALLGDLHLDSAFEGAAPGRAPELRRGQRRLLFDAVAAAKAAGADIILCTGDIFDTQTPYFETVAAARDALSGAGIPVFITPGNHDYYDAASPYALSGWGKDVHIFKTAVPETVFLPELGISVTGAANAGFRDKTAPFEELSAPEGPGLNILMFHGEIAPSSDYMRISRQALTRSGFDLAALGHVHTYCAEKIGKTLCVKNGGMEGRGYDEPGEKGMVLVDGKKGELAARLLPLGGTRCVRASVCINEKSPEGEVLGVKGPDRLAAELSEISPWPPERTFLRAELSGTGLPDIPELKRLLSGFLSLKIADRTSPFEPGAREADDKSLVGIFLSKLQSLESEEPGRAAMISAAREFGLAAAENREQPDFAGRLPEGGNEV